MSEIIFPERPANGTVFFHGDNVCVFHTEDNTWECRAISSETPQPSSNINITTSNVYTVGDKRTTWQSKLGIGGISFALPTVRTQDEVNDAIMDLLCYVKSNSSSSTTTITGASEEWIQANYAPLNHNHNYAAVNHVHSEYITRDEYNSMITTLMTTIANSNSNSNSGY